MKMGKTGILDEEFICATLKYEDEKQLNTKIQQDSRKI